jgi:hypothetical protein
MIKTYYAGQELDAPCGRCKSETRHWILSITDKIPGKLICTGCKSVHKFRAEKPKKQISTTQPLKNIQSKNKTESVPLSKFQELVIAEQIEMSSIPHYSISQQWNEGMWIRHPSFGLGRIQKRLGKKIDVLFRDGIKTLISS